MPPTLFYILSVSLKYREDGASVLLEFVFAVLFLISMLVALGTMFGLIKLPQPLWFKTTAMGVATVITIPFTFAYLFELLQVYGGCLVSGGDKVNALYFSYVTNTSLGYGDIAPLGFCRFLAVANVTLGQISFGLFVAFAIASLLEPTRKNLKPAPND